MDARCDTGADTPCEDTPAAFGVSPRRNPDGDVVGTVLAIGALMATVVAVAAGVGGGSRWTAAIVVAVWASASLLGELVERVPPRSSSTERPVGADPGPG